MGGEYWKKEMEKQETNIKVVKVKRKKKKIT